jgi:RNA polymerase-binding transcription factor DksA
MHHLPKDFLNQIKKHLKIEEKRLVKEEEELKEQDPFMVPGRDVGNQEFVEEAGEEIGHERVEMEKGIIRKLLSDTRAALARLKIGKYGVCDKCGEHIDRARLKAVPHARYCLKCEKRLESKS